MRRLLALAILLTGVAFGFECDEKVVDDAHVLGHGLPQVNQAVLDLERVGAEVRVRTIPNLGEAGNVDRYEATMEKACQSWQGAQGGRKNTLVVMLVSVKEKKSGIFFGSQFDRALGPQYLRLETETMNPHFRDGDYSGGFVAGLNQIQHLIEGERPPDPVAINRAKAEDRRLILLWGCGVVLLAACAWGIYRVQWKSQKRLIAQRKAKASKQAVANLVVKLEGSAEPVETLVREAPEAERESLLARVSQARQLITSAAQAYGEADTVPGNPDKHGLTVEEYETMDAGYDKLADDLRAAERLLGDVDRQLSATRRPG